MRRSVVACSLMCLAVGFLAGCPDRSIDEVKPQQGLVETKDVPVEINRDIDILFLIDDSPSMADKQANLADNFPKFIDVLRSIQGGLPNVHIGVATSDMGTQGALDTNPNFGPTVGAGGVGACAGIGKDGQLQTFGAPVTGPFIVDTADPTTGMRMPNYTGDLTTVFAQIAKGAGAKGCGFEQHLAAVKRALTNPANNGFLRDNAYLAVIIIADEDDCSLAHYSLLDTNANATLGELQSFRCTRFGVLCNQGGQDTNQMNQVGTKGQCHPNDDSQYLAKINDYVTFLKGLKSNPNKVIVAGILGTTSPFAVEMRAPLGSNVAIPALAHSCSYTDRNNQTEVADPPIRTKAFLDQFPDRSTFVPICQNDLSGGLQQIGELLKTVIGDPCIEGKLVNFAQPGDPPLYDCSVSYVTNPGTSSAVETVIGRCPSPSNEPCWEIVPPDPMKCAAGATAMLQIQNDAQLHIPNTDIHEIANCVTQAQ